MSPNTKAWRKARKRLIRRGVPIRVPPNFGDAVRRMMSGPRLLEADVAYDDPETRRPLIRYRYDDGTVRLEWATGWSTGSEKNILLDQG